MLGVFQKRAEEYRARGEWLLFLETRRHMDRDGGPSALNEVPLSVQDEEYRALVRNTYTWTHGIWENRGAWFDIFQGARRPLNFFGSDGDRISLTKLPDPLMVYRGCCEHNQPGFSWTIDRQRAEHFAAFSQGHLKASRRIIVSGKIAHSRILAYITERDEEEIVALPENVADQRTEDITHLPPVTESMMKRLGKNTK